MPKTGNYFFTNLFMLQLVFGGLFSSCTQNNTSAYAGFEDSTVQVYGQYRVYLLPVTKGVKILNPIQLSSGPEGKMYASNNTGEIYTLMDSDDDGVEDSAALFCNVTDNGLRSPSGFTHRGDTIYIGTSQEIRIYLDKNKDGRADTSWTFFRDIPYSEHPYEWTCGLNFGPDGWLYCALSTDSWNSGASPDPQGYRGSILRISPDGRTAEKVATGIRSVYSLAFHKSGDLFFIDNEGGGNSNEELNLLRRNGFYGHNPKKYSGFSHAINPAFVLQTEIAPSGITFNRTGKDIGDAGEGLWVSYYGPGERWQRGAISRLELRKENDTTYHFKETAVADIPKLSALAFGKDGSLYIAHHGRADYWYNSVEQKSGGFYRMVYDPAIPVASVKKRTNNRDPLTQGSVDAGRQLFAEQACAACHATDGKTELLGPNLFGISDRFSREEILESVNEPSKIIKPSMGATRITKKDGSVLLGRVVNADEQQISIMLIGNSVVTISRKDIAESTEVKESLMYPNLLKGLSEEQKNQLLDYLASLR